MTDIVNAYKMLYSGATIDDIRDTLGIQYSGDNLLDILAIDLDDDNVYSVAEINDECKAIIMDSPFSDEYYNILSTIEDLDDLDLICESIDSIMQFYPDEIDIAYTLYKRGFEIKDALANVLEERYYNTGKDEGYSIQDIYAFKTFFEINKNNLFIIDGRYYSDHDCLSGIGKDSLERWLGKNENSIEER